VIARVIGKNKGKPEAVGEMKGRGRARAEPAAQEQKCIQGEKTRERFGAKQNFPGNRRRGHPRAEPLALGLKTSAT